MLANDQRKKSGVGADFDRRVRRAARRSSCARRNVCSSPSCSRAVASSCPGSGCVSCFALRHDSIGSPPFKRPASVRNSSCVACSSRVGDREQPIDRAARCLRRRRSFCSNFSWPRRNDAFARGRDVVFEVVDVAADRRAPPPCDASARSASRCRSSSRGERLRQIGVDERHHAAQRVEPDLDEHRGRLFDVVARGLDQARRLPQLRQDAAGALGLRRVVEDRLRGEARGQRLGVGMRIALPRPHVLELEQPRADVRRDNGVLDPLGLGQTSSGMASSRRANPASALRCVSMAGLRKSSSRSSCR